MSDYPVIAVIGAGAFGTALANVAARDDRDIRLIARDSQQASAMQASRENKLRLPGVMLAPQVVSTADPSAIESADLIVLATPAQSVRSAGAEIAARARASVPIVSTAKGIERGSGLFPSDILASACPHSPIAVLSGPSFAADLARGLPTAVALASPDAALAKRIAEALSSPTFRLYHGADMRGAEIGGAAKNVLAIAAGVVAGKGLGESARAALVARGFAELQRFALAFGGKPETLMGLSGLGDLVLSCASSRSRNFAFGEALGLGVKPDAAARSGLAEGAFTADVLVEIARERGVEMPICEAVAALIAGRVTVEETAAALMTRPLRAEA